MPGRLDFDLSFGKKARPTSSGGDVVCRLLLVGEFSGGGGAARSAVRIDVERFDEVMRGLAPRLTLDAGPTLELPGLDDFHPDQLYRSFDAFAGLRELRRRLLDPATFAETAARMEGAGAPAPARAAEDDGDTLARLLGSRPRAAAIPGQARADLGGLLREIVAPHVVPAIDSQQKRLVGAADEAAGQHMRALLHHPPFQRLEARWRAVHRLVSTVDPDAEVQVFLLDATTAELPERIGDTGPWTLVALDDYFGPDDAARLPALGVPVVAGAAPALLGDADLTGALRASPEASDTALAGPRWLVRLPYGAKSDPIESFAFDELGAVRPHDGYLWANPAFAVAQLVAAAHREGAPVIELDDLPAHTYKEDGESHLQAVAEAYLGERAVTTLVSRGLIPLVSARDRNALRAARLQTLAGTPL
jgi:type VI secretion system protein ImpC